jgi:hypothetical protein
VKLSSVDTARLCTILSTCSVGGIESIIIENGYVRGINESRSYAIFSNQDVPEFPQKIGLSRLGALKQRLDLFVGNKDSVIEAKESERGEISSLEISLGKNKVQFRCTSTMLIKAPKSISDPAAFKISMSKEELKMLLNAIKIMGGKTVQLIIRKDLNVEFKASDATNDVFSSNLITPAEVLGESQDSVVHYYHTEIFSAAMRSNVDTDFTFTVGESGTISTRVHGYDIKIISKMHEEEE